jgi:hypothetical protein
MSILLVLAVAPACVATVKLPDLGGLYSEAAQRHEPSHNPVIVVPGILGSRLQDDESGRVVWGAFSGDYADPRTPDGARLLALPMAEGAPLDQLRDGVRSDGALDRVRLRILGIPLALAAYTNILATLGVGGYRDEQLGMAGAVDYGSDHYTCFQFDYDWRRDVPENARRFGEFLKQRRAYVREESKKRFGVEEDVRFDVVAHSMGGLLVRYYLRYGMADLPTDGSLPEITWAGAEDLEHVVLIGTPNAGSVNALYDMVDGAKLGPFIPRYPPAVLGTMPAVYQLLPRARHGALVDEGDPDASYDPLDVDLWTRMGWGLADPDQEGVLEHLLPDVPDPAERRRIALDHLAKCLTRARYLSAALDVPADRPPGLSLSLFVGDAEDTRSKVAVDATTGGLTVVAAAPGDGTVTRASALMDERMGREWSPRLESPIDWGQVHFLFTDHLGMTRDPAFTDNVLYLLLEAPRP